MHFRLHLYLLRILSVYYCRLLFFCWGKMLSKTAPCFALVITGTFSEFLACITVVFLFCKGEMVSKTALSFALVPSLNSKLVNIVVSFFARMKWSIKLHFRLRSYLLRILSVYYRRLLFSAGVKCSQKPLPAMRLSLQVPSLNS